MRKLSLNQVETARADNFDLVRLNRSKSVVDICPNTLRSYFKQGLPFYKKGKAIFFSKSELLTFIKAA